VRRLPIVTILNCWLVLNSSVLIQCTAPGDGPQTQNSSKAGYSIFNEYSFDDMGHEHIGYTFHVPDSLPLIQRLQVVADTLSQRSFASFPLEVLRIDTVEVSLIAVVDLRQPDTLRTWTQSFFQGSHGGGSTTTTLRKTLLQPEYKGRWIDGVQFYHDGEPLDPDGSGYDHIDLAGIFYRDGRWTQPN
jgi:hypothetical protein